MASGRWEVTNREKRGLEMGNGKALGGAHPERGACEGAVGDQVTCLEVGGAFPRTILSCGTCGKEREEGSELLERCPCGRAGGWGEGTGRRGHGCHLVGQACYFSWRGTPGPSSAER